MTAQTLAAETFRWSVVSTKHTRTAEPEPSDGRQFQRRPDGIKAEAEQVQLEPLISCDQDTGEAVK
jgi:hypothetical protein